jgi:2-C-methyl-D-erythritol 4-phosphate cytidylyltransferase
VNGPIWGIVVAAGLGRRFGGTKQFECLGGRPVHERAVASARSVVVGVVLVVPAESETDAGLLALADRVVAGGDTRAASVRAGLRAVPEDAEIVVVHDAARPLASADLFRAVVDAVTRGAEGAVPGVPVSDTLKRLDRRLNRMVVRETVDRTDLVRVQTPQAFRASALRRGHEGEPEVTDDAAVIEALGGVVVVVPGEEGNVKITTPEDLAMLEWRLRSTSAS